MLTEKKNQILMKIQKSKLTLGSYFIKFNIDRYFNYAPVSTCKFLTHCYNNMNVERWKMGY